jgi:glutamine amidotransferase-like uncharacterized protein
MKLRFSPKAPIKICLAFFLIALLPLSIALRGGEGSTLTAESDLSGIRVGVFNAGTLAADSDVALYHMFEWMGATVEYVNGPVIRGGILDSLDIIAFPGGSMLSYSFNLTQTGMDLIRFFMASGGSYFGICGGALFATDYLNLCAGSWDTNIPGIGTGTHLTTMAVHQDCTGPKLSDEPNTYETLYWGSSFFSPENPNNIMPIMSYVENDEPGMFVAKYGSGTLFCSSPHPEYEEGSSRDGTAQFDSLSDPDSEWELLQKVTQWLIDESPANSNPLSPLESLVGIFVAGFVISAIIATIGIALYYKRRRSND